MLDHCRNEGRAGIASASEPFSALLTHWYRAVEARTENDNTATSMFARRAWGDLAAAGGGPSVRWDDDEHLFRSTPWTLEVRSSRAAPEDAVIVADVHRTGRLVFLRRLAADCGYRFLENRSFPAAVPNTHWCRVYEVHGPESSDTPVVAFWQRRGDADFFYACKGAAWAAAPAPFRRWLDRAERVGARRFTGPPRAID